MNEQNFRKSTNRNLITAPYAPPSRSSVPKRPGRPQRRLSNEGRAGPGGFSWRTKPKQNNLFTKKVSKVRNISHIQCNHRSPAIAVFHPSTRPRLKQADAGFLNHVQAAKKPGGRPGRLGILSRRSNDSTSPDGPSLGQGLVRSGLTRRSDWTGPQTGSLGLDGLGLDQSKRDNLYQYQSRSKTKEVR